MRQGGLYQVALLALVNSLACVMKDLN